MRPIHAVTASVAFAALAFSAAPAHADGLPVAFTGCTEAVGLDVIPAANARPLVPEQFVLAPADEAGELAIMLVRVVECEGIAVGPLPPSPGRFAHVGVALANGEPGADANNFQLTFATDHGPLLAAMLLNGVSARYDHDLVFDHGEGPIDIAVDPAGGASYSGSGSGFLYPIERVPFLAAWYAQTRCGVVQMRIEYDGVQFGGSDVVVTLPAGSSLAALAGRTTLSFAVLNTYNDFLTGDMTYNRVD